MWSATFSGWLRSSLRKRSLAYYRLSGNILAVSSNDHDPVTTWMNLRGAEVSCDASKKLIKVQRSGKSYTFYTTVEEYNSWSSAFLNAAKLNVREVYTWNRVLGAGAFATVRLATTNMGVPICHAVKIITKSEVKKREVEFVVRELRTVLTCKMHPNLVHTNAVYEDENYVYLAMEYMAGGSLSDYMSRRHAPLTETELRPVMRALLSGIAELHRRNAVHRDIKPENILLENEHDLYSVKLGDFGFCRFLEDGALMTETLGTVSFMAPELINRKGYGKAVDMWSIGITMYNLLTGAFPFQSSEDVGIIKELKELNSFSFKPIPNLSAEGTALLKRFLTVNRTARITAEEALESNWLKVVDSYDAKKDIDGKFSLQSLSEEDFEEFRDSTLGFEPSTAAASVFSLSVPDIDSGVLSSYEMRVQSLVNFTAKTVGWHGSGEDDTDAYNPVRRLASRFRQQVNLPESTQKTQGYSNPQSPTHYSDHFEPRSSKLGHAFLPVPFSKKVSTAFMFPSTQ
eukprot:Plantae.Rhodophyta-Purpureofilum_apyrenoidigerum.ctg18414.p1 GENE.Plantae.Rhodophyta-Purpureofilum_apyrenoidigerum.ctg18414~~Plantae.Rhodophyta-Purpureofilum_apyrenoidigerum.ctg18414.p1  ORF type:complete len:514 (-),score=97.48 Plantae.Rhodophyta-Purpureofilum_apyrenoidigerum.ctg18414:573-2114(-)